MENDWRKNMELQKLEENEQQSSQGYSDISSDEAFEKFIKECKEPLLDDSEDDEIYSESKSDDWVWGGTMLLLCLRPALGGKAAGFIPATLK